MAQSLPPSSFARAVDAISGQRIITSAQGLEALDVRIPTRHGEMPAYLARPEKKSDLPIILVAQEIFGLHEHIKDIARRFAARGYLAIAPDYFFRVGDPLTAADIPAIREIVAKAPDAEAMSDLDSALAFAAECGGDASRAAVVGFCWGGRMAWLYAAHNQQLRAAIPCYGRLDGERTQNQPRWPLDIAKELKVPSLGLYGGADPSIPLDQVKEMRALLLAAKAPAELIVYDDAPHAFFADYRESYRAGPAENGWSRMLDFLRGQGVA